MKKIVNAESISGRLYQHNLELKTVKNKDSANFGKEFISGTIDIATDDEGLNVIPVHFTYVVEMTKNGKKNATFGVLKSIIEGAKTWIVDGPDEALKVRVSTALALNDFYTDDDNLVSAKRNEGGFVNVIKELPPVDERSTFRFDMVITSVLHVDADEENNIPEDCARIRGAIFNFRGDLLPVELTCHIPAAMDYFERLDASAASPVFTEVRGNIINNVIKQEITEESAFGTASVRTVSRTVRRWAVNWARPTEYDFGADDVLTADELKQKMQDRQVYLAEVKKRYEDYKASQAKGSAVDTSPKESENAIPDGGFDF